MAAGILGSLSAVINKTTGEIIDANIPSKVAGVITTFVTSSFEVVDAVLAKIQEITKEEPPSGGS